MGFGLLLILMLLPLSVYSAYAADAVRHRHSAAPVGADCRAEAVWHRLNKQARPADELWATPIDYHSEDFVDVIRRVEPGGLDGIVDGMMRLEMIRRSLPLLRSGGRMVSYGEPANLGELSRILGLALKTRLAGSGKAFKLYGTSTYFLGNLKPYLEVWATLFSLLEEGQIKPVIVARFPILEAARANELLESGEEILSNLGEDGRKLNAFRCQAEALDDLRSGYRPGWLWSSWWGISLNRSGGAWLRSVSCKFIYCYLLSCHWQTRADAVRRKPLGAEDGDRLTGEDDALAFQADVQHAAARRSLVGDHLFLV